MILKESSIPAGRFSVQRRMARKEKKKNLTASSLLDSRFFWPHCRPYFLLLCLFQQFIAEDFQYFSHLERTGFFSFGDRLPDDM